MNINYFQRKMQRIPLFLKEKGCGALVRMCTDRYGKVRRKAPQKPALGIHHNACKASASCTDSALHICRRQMLHAAKPCFIQSAFTLIELLVVIAIIAILAAILLPGRAVSRFALIRRLNIFRNKCHADHFRSNRECPRDFYCAATDLLNRFFQFREQIGADISGKLNIRGKLFGCHGETQRGTFTDKLVV